MGMVGRTFLMLEDPEVSRIETRLRMTCVEMLRRTQNQRMEDMRKNPRRLAAQELDRVSLERPELTQDSELRRVVMDRIYRGVDLQYVPSMTDLRPLATLATEGPDDDRPVLEIINRVINRPGINSMLHSEQFNVAHFCDVLVQEWRLMKDHYDQEADTGSASPASSYSYASSRSSRSYPSSVSSISGRTTASFSPSPFSTPANSRGGSASTSLASSVSNSPVTSRSPSPSSLGSISPASYRSRSPSP